MTCLGKIIGGGMPLAAYGGKRAIMEKIAPLGPVYQAGTLSGNPVAVSAALAMLERPRRRRLRRSSRALGARLEAGLVDAAKKRERRRLRAARRLDDHAVLHRGSGEDASTDAMKSRHQALRPLARRDARARVSTGRRRSTRRRSSARAHDDADIDATIAAADEALAASA